MNLKTRIIALVAATAIAVPVVIAALLALPVGTLKDAKNGRVIYEKETEYQYARVIEKAGGERLLELNEGHAVHSRYRPGTVLTNDYWDAMLFDSGDPRSVAILGNAAGTTARAFDALRPATKVDAVEIDPELTKIGRRWFGLPRSIGVHHEDARPLSEA